MTRAAVGLTRGRSSYLLLCELNEAQLGSVCELRKNIQDLGPKRTHGRSGTCVRFFEPRTPEVKSKAKVKVKVKVKAEGWMGLD